MLARLTAGAAAYKEGIKTGLCQESEHLLAVKSGFQSVSSAADLQWRLGCDLTLNQWVLRH